MAPASVQVVCMEPVVFLRGQSAVGEDARGRRRQIDFDAPPSQLRGLLTLHLPRPSRIKEISITIQGKARTDWPEGIGPNRLDTVEESIIFKQKVTLYNARETAPSRTRPRASSVGPGINWAKDDLEWPTTSGQNDPQSSSSNAALGAALHHSEGRKSPKIPRSLSKTAAKAGAAILPPTLMRDLQANRQGHSHLARPQSSNTLHRSEPGSPSPTRMCQSATNTPQLSPHIIPRPSSAQAAPDRGESYFDPPPMYVTSTDAVPIPPLSLGNSSMPGSQSSPSSSSSNLGVIDATGREASPWNSAPAPRVSPPHPQSISAAGPGQRSILHTTARSTELRSRTRGDSPSNGPPVVRFDPQAVNSELQRQTSAVDLDTALSRSTSASATDLISSPQPASVHSDPSTRRASLDHHRSASAGAGFSSAHQITPNNAPTATAKGKGRATASPVQSPSVPVRRGIKGLLGSLRKDEEPESRPIRSAATNHQSSSPATWTYEEESQMDWREFPKGTHSYPFSIPLPSNLPPTLHADFGSNAYILRAHVHRAGPLTSNLSSETEVTLVHAPDEDGSDEVETIVVERNWEDALRYMIVVLGKSFPVGGRIPVWTKFVPMEKVRIHRIFASIEERTAYYAKGRRIARHEVPRRWNLLKVMPPSKAPSQQGILPILSNDPNAILESPLAPMARAAAVSYSDALAVGGETDAEYSALASLADPTGPWELAMDLELPTCASTRINISSNHIKSNIAVHHIVKLSIRVERLDAYGTRELSKIPDHQRKLYDILIEAPVAINHSHTANAWLTLPDYWSVPAIDEDDRATASAARQASADTFASPDFASIPSSPRRKAEPSNQSAGRPASSPEGDRRGKNVLNPLRTVGSSNGSSSSASPSAAQAKDARTANLTRLSRQWLSLTGAANARGRDAAGDTVERAPQSAQATVTFGGSFLNEAGDLNAGLPTYAMIDSARGSVDPPPDQRAHPEIK